MLSADEFSGLLAEYRRKYPTQNALLENISFQAARDLFFQERYAPALAQLNSYLTDYPSGPNQYAARVLRAEAQEKLGNLDAALTDYEAVYNAPTAAEFKSRALLGAAEILVKLQRNEQAFELFGRAETEADQQADRIRAKLARADLASGLNKPQEALRIFREVANLTELPEATRTLARLNIGKTYRQLNQRDSALLYVSPIAATETGSVGAEAQYWRTQLFFDDGKLDSALAAVKVMNERFRTFGVWRAKAFLVAAEVYVKQGKRLNAMETLKSIASNAPNAEIKTLAQTRLAEVERQVQADNNRRQQQQQRERDSLRNAEAPR
jgi:tetratricopeptide (TPR) repeat protein